MRPDREVCAANDNHRSGGQGLQSHTIKLPEIGTLQPKVQCSSSLVSDVAQPGGGGSPKVRGFTGHEHMDRTGFLCIVRCQPSGLIF